MSVCKKIREDDTIDLTDGNPGDVFVCNLPDEGNGRRWTNPNYRINIFHNETFTMISNVEDNYITILFKVGIIRYTRAYFDYDLKYGRRRKLS